MEESRGQHGVEEYRSVQELVKQGHYHEALERAHGALIQGQMGRRMAARLNSLLCWLYVSGLQEPSPTAVLHGEEAVRLAELCGDAWVRCEALTRLVPAYCQMGDLGRAEQGCEALASELQQNEMVIPGGWGALWLLRALVATAAGDLERAQLCLDEVQGLMQGPPEPDLSPSDLRRRLKEHQAVIEALRAPDRTGPVEARWRARTCCLEGDGDRAQAVRAVAVEALLAEPVDGPAAQAHAQVALHRAIAIGRTDLVRLFRRRLAHLLDG